MSEATIDTVNFTRMREAMVASQLRTNAVSDPRVVSAMARVPREDFLPENQRTLAYRDTAVPIAHGRAANLPIATGKLLTQAQVRATDHVLLIGAAGGYAAAVLALLARDVVAVESDPALATLARTALSAYSNVELIEADLATGAPKQAPYDLLVVDGAVEHLPQALIDQVQPGGRVVTGIEDRGVTRLAAGVRSAGGFGLTTFADVDCVSLPGFTRPKTFTF
ncbi:protein-L-isoaspartate O-methyltransferase family protein [Hephaestia mangrovi]|uniref:protein-L-isoaspartate O-methyltransferase family protein n=1 Tax=Hephaestia mangrovi TaxID=2873268 RepID=UPI001CA76DD1|nr:rRNA adenine N-6-methyltransferase family protein [Hephaestia mangrovi]MBY8827612.1 protein-L-isoaspartate O-methyltransferase [Hephaestia mangrovi]